jgi:Phage integrase family
MRTPAARRERPVQHPGHASPTQEDDHGNGTADDQLDAATRSLEQGRRRCGQNMFGRSVPDCRWAAARAIWRCSISQSTASCGAATSSHFGSKEDVAPSGYAVDRATVRQKKTGRPVRFELTEQTRQAVDDYIKAAGKKPGEFLFSGRGDHGRCMTTRQYARLVSIWVATIGLDPHFFGTHSLRRTKATLIYRRTGNLRAVQLLLGHTKIESTVRYLGIEVNDALAIADQVDV